MRTEVRCRDCGRVYDGAVVADRFGGVCPRCLAGFALSPTDAGAKTLIEEEPLPLKPGATFRGLEVIDVLGRGGMGVVYRARQIELGRAVALKVLSPKLAAEPEFAERFQREARAMATLSHANIVHVYDFGREGDVYFLAMEFIDGVSLRSLMGEERLETAKALSIVGQICEALEYAHAQGVVHRDIKPENVLVDKAGCVKIADFGLAKVLGAKAMPTLTRTDVAMGTPQYMAPEQYASMKDVDGRADIYSLGVMFYEMLTGELPAGAFEPPSKKAAVDARLDGVVLKAMAKEPERRYQRALQVKTDVETVRTSPPPPAAGAWPRRTWLDMIARTLGWTAFTAGMFSYVGAGVFEGPSTEGVLNLLAIAFTWTFVVAGAAAWNVGRSEEGPSRRMDWLHVAICAHAGGIASAAIANKAYVLGGVSLVFFWAIGYGWIRIMRWAAWRDRVGGPSPLRAFASDGRRVAIAAVSVVVLGGIIAVLNAFPGPRLVSARGVGLAVAVCGAIGLALGAVSALRRRFLAAGIAGAGAVACILGGATLMRLSARGWEAAADRQAMALVSAAEGSRLAQMGKWAEAEKEYEEAERLGGTIDSRRGLERVREALRLKNESGRLPGPDGGERDRKRREIAGRLKDIALQCGGVEPTRLEDFVITPERGPEGLTLAAPNEWVLPGAILDQWDLLLRLRDAVFPGRDFSRVSRAYRAVFDNGAAFVILEFPDAESLQSLGDATPAGSCSRFVLGSRLLAAVYQTRRREWISEAFIVDWLQRFPRGRAARVDDFLLENVDLPGGVRFASAATTTSDPDGIAALLARAGVNNVAKDEVVRAYVAEMAEDSGGYVLCVLATKGDAPVLRVAEAAALSPNRRAWWAHDLVAVVTRSGTPDERRRQRLERVIEARARAATGRHLAYESDIEDAFRELPAGWNHDGAAPRVKHESTKACCASCGALVHIEDVDEYRRALKDGRGDTARVTTWIAHSSVAVAVLSKRVREALGETPHERIEDGWTLIVVQGADFRRLAEWVRRRLCIARGAPEAVFEK